MRAPSRAGPGQPDCSLPDLGDPDEAQKCIWREGARRAEERGNGPGLKTRGGRLGEQGSGVRPVDTHFANTNSPCKRHQSHVLPREASLRGIRRKQSGHHREGVTWQSWGNLAWPQPTIQCCGKPFEGSQREGGSRVKGTHRMRPKCHVRTLKGSRLSKNAALSDIWGTTGEI